MTVTRTLSLTLPLILTQNLTRYFNYTPDAGGLGRETLRRVVFKDGRLAVPDYPNLPYALVGPAGLVGSRVVATGLRGRPELNGAVGTVLSLDVPTARYAVR